MKNKITFYALAFSLSCIILSCNSKKVENPIIDKPHQIKLEHLTDREKDQITFLSQEMNEIFKNFAYVSVKYDPYGSDESMEHCGNLQSVQSRILKFPFSVERELSLDRLANFIQSNNHCSRNEVADYNSIVLEENNWINLYKTDNSSLVPEALAWFENNRSNYKKAKKLLKEGLRNNPNDLRLYSSLFLINNNSKMEDKSILNEEEEKLLQQDYCKKAVELKQWDHIYYLTDYMQIMPCAFGESDKWWDHDNNRQIKCKCKGAMQLVVKHWPDEYIENAIYEHLNPHVDRPLNGDAYAKEIKNYRQELFDAAHKYFGRPD